MRSLIFFVNLFNGIIVLSFLLAFSLTFLNFTFTHDDLPDDNIPYYIHDIPGDLTEKDSGRYGLYWWVYASDALRILVPFLLLGNILVLRYGGPALTILVQFLFVLFLLWEIAKFIWAVILFVPKNCDDHQFCRNLGARRDAGGMEIGDPPGSQNFTYSFYTFYSLAFFIVMIFALILIGAMEGALYQWQRLRESMKALLGDKAESAVSAPTSTNAWLTFTLGLVMTLALVFYFPFVFLNFTFTNSKETGAMVPPSLRANLPDDNIPYYIHDIPDDPNEGDSGRFGLYWWVYAADTLMILVPLAAVANVNDKAYQGGGCTILVQIFILLLLVWQLVKFLWTAILSVPSLCETHQFCRAFGARRIASAEIGDSPRNLNFVFSTYIWFNLALAILMLVILIVVSMLKGAIGRRTVTRYLPYANKVSGMHTSQAVSKRTPRSTPRKQRAEKVHVLEW